MIIQFKNLFRPTYEGYAAATWSASAVLMSAIGLLSSVPSRAFVTMAGMSVGMATIRWIQAKKLWDYKLSMTGKAFSFLDGREVVAYNRAHPDRMWIGFGFEWEPSHTQLAFDALKKNFAEIYPPSWYLRARGVTHDPRAQKGLAWVHGLEPQEQQLSVPFTSLEGHTAVFGTTGAGKTRLYEVFLLQMAARGDAIFVFDPKGDKDLEKTCRDVAKFIGHPERFIKFHPAFPMESVRLDPMKNFNRGTETASRVSALTSSESGKDTFTAVTWDAINSIGASERYLGFRPQLASALRQLSGGVESLLENVLRKYMNEYAPGWQSQIRDLIGLAEKGKIKTNMSNASSELLAGVTYYKREIKGTVKGREADVLENLLRIAEYPRDWHSKMVATVIPLLTMLNSEELGKMLSPDYDDIEDTRPIFDTRKVIDGRYIFYIGLDSLSDPEVGSAIASIVLSDCASVAGSLYNYGTNGEEKIKVQLVIDEAAEVVNAPLVQLLNKGRGAGFSITMAAQNYADYVNRMGTDAKARMLLGNCNNLYALRVMDGQTQDFIVEKLGETFIKQGSRSQGSGNRTEDHGLEFSGSISESVSEQRVEKFPKDLLGKLPDLQYVALLAGGRLLKGRIPKVEIEFP
jgi:conjugal transfer pilus assembly protein TraD